MEDIARRVLDGYGLTGYSLLPVQKGYRNRSFAAQLSDGPVANLILYKREPGMLERIKRANAVGDYVYRHGLPARRTRSPKIARLSSPQGNVYAALYDYLPGRTIPWEAYTRKHIKLLGKTMSDLHAVLREFDAYGLPNVVDEYLVIVRRMRAYFAQPGVQAALSSKLALRIPDVIFVELDALLHACSGLSESQALHMDFVRGNILFGTDAYGPIVTGILDFEKTAKGHPIFDAARTLAFLLVDCKYKLADKVRKYFLYSGYKKSGNADLANIPVRTAQGKTDLLEELLNLFLLYDFYKFLRHNPYESLHQNEHFIRTRDLLLERILAQHT